MPTQPFVSVQQHATPVLLRLAIMGRAEEEEEKEEEAAARQPAVSFTYAFWFTSASIGCSSDNNPPPANAAASIA